MAAINSSKDTCAFAAGAAGRLLNDLNTRIGEGAKKPDPDAVHDIRVDIRKLTQALVVFKPCFPAKPEQKLERKLKEIMDLSSDVRDNDIAVKLLKKAKLKSAKRLMPAFKKRRKRTARAFAKVLRRWMKRDLSTKWRTDLVADARKNEAAPVQPLEQAAEQFLGSMTRSFFIQGGEAVKLNSPRELHKFRIAAKKLRYTIQLLEPARNGASGERLKQIEQVQRLLGQVNDYAATRRLVAKKGASGKLSAWLKKKERQNIKEFRQFWSEQVTRPEPVHRRPVRTIA